MRSGYEIRLFAKKMGGRIFLGKSPEDEIRLLPIVLVKKHYMLKAVLVFCQKRAKIMLIFSKSTRGLHKNAHFFRFFKT